MERKTFLHQNCNILKNVRITEQHFKDIEDGRSSVVVLPLDSKRTKSKVARWREYAAVRRMSRRLENVVELVVDGFKHYYLFTYNADDFLMDVKDIDNGKENSCDVLLMRILARVSFA